MGILTLIITLLNSILISMMIFNKSLTKFLLSIWTVFAAQVIFATYFLSLFNQVELKALLLFHMLIFIITLLFLFKYNWQIKIDFNIKLKLKELKQEKAIFFFVLAIIILLFYNLIISIILPPMNNDGLSYHLSRIVQWIQNKNINHFYTNDLREVDFPPNSEILMMWTMLVSNTDYFVQIIQWSAAVYIAICIYGLGRIANFNIKQAVLPSAVFLTLPMIVLQNSSVQNDLVVTSFFLPAFYFLIIYIYTEKKIINIVYSASLLGLAIGTKYTIIYFIPIIIIYIIFCLFRYKERFSYKDLTLAASIYILGFLFLGSYNNFSNYISYKNPVGSDKSIETHTSVNLPFENFVRYTFQMIDFTGAPPKVNSKLSDIQKRLEHAVYTSFGIQRNSVEKAIRYEDRPYWFISRPHEDFAAFGILGFLSIVFIPFGLRKNSFARLYYIIGISWFLVFDVLVSWTPYKTRYFVLPISFIIIGIGMLNIEKSVRNRIIYFLICLISVYTFTYVSIMGRNKNIKLVFNYPREQIMNIDRLNMNDKFAYEVLRLAIKDGTNLAQDVPMSDAGGYGLYKFLRVNKVINVSVSNNVDEILHKYDADYLVIKSEKAIIDNVVNIPHTDWYVAVKGKKYVTIQQLLQNECGTNAIIDYDKLTQNYYGK